MHPLRHFLQVAALLALATTLSGALPAGAATITIVNADGANEGFNDPTPVAPVGGNPGTTLGAQRLFVFQYAADIWGGLLVSPVTIVVNAKMDPQTCDAASGVLGSASAGSSQRNFANAPFADTWYQQALANSLAGVDLNVAPDMNITFNVSIGTPTCLPQGWYLGVDGNEGSAIELLPVVLHELGHGLGFATITLAGVQMGTPPGPHVYDRFLYDNTQQMHWNEMLSDAQRAASANNCQNLVWDGPLATQQAVNTLGPKPLLRVNSPATIAGDYEVGLPSFGPGLSTGGLTGNLVQVQDSGGLPNNGCEPFTNGAAIAGNIALIDRGGCNFTAKVKRAQLAGAIAVVIADSTAGCPPAGMGGVDPTITIPSVRVTLDDGLRLKSALALGVNVTMILDPALRAGADQAGRVLVYTPIPFATGSSVSHWDTSPTPNLLMEPAINPDLSAGVDLALPHFADIGWQLSATSSVAGEAPPPRQLIGSFPNPFRQATSIRFTLARPSLVDVGVFDLAGRLVKRLAAESMMAGSHVVTWDGRDAAGRQAAAGIYLYRLTTPSGSESGRMVLMR
jgi:hypothetical protein